AAEQTAQQAVWTNDRIAGYRQDRVVVGERREVLATNQRRERIDRFVLAEDLVAMGGEALTECQPGAGTNADDHALLLRRSVVEDGAELRVEPVGATLRRATRGRSDRGVRSGEDRNDRCDRERELSKHSSHAMSPRYADGRDAVSRKGTARAG